MSDGDNTKPAPMPVPIFHQKTNGATAEPHPPTPPQAVMPQQQKPPKPKKDIPLTQNKVIGAKLIIQYRGEDGKIHDATTTISSEEFKVEKYMLDIEEKHELKRDPETKDIIGKEDTGDRILKFTLKYHVR